jgi:DNA-binding response OmpR family regulator
MSRPDEFTHHNGDGATQETVLVVEDESSVRQTISLILQEEGYRVLEATNAEAALSLLQHGSPDLILSDVMMPGMNGFAFYLRVRSNPDWSQIPFIFLTARDQKADVRFGMGLGADDYLVKPFEPEDLLIAVQVRLARAAQAKHSAR